LGAVVPRHLARTICTIRAPIVSESVSARGNLAQSRILPPMSVDKLAWTVREKQKEGRG